MALHTKMRTNVSIDPELLEAARSRGIKLSPLLEEAIRERLRQDWADQWRRENRESIVAYNREVRERGVFSDGLRDF